ncbi:MAG: hypothetical protein H6774_01220 [Pseudomonadales bacterium]|nr:hypothetical protein [Pseudomonadales bacterium]
MVLETLARLASIENDFGNIIAPTPSDWLEGEEENAQPSGSNIGGRYIEDPYEDNNNHLSHDDS